ncbi:MAG: hypothetical protein HY318_08765 [Armatimonadetes bacterium]|nr:hypothetical protein [Armatimonadota bacterium]
MDRSRPVQCKEASLTVLVSALLITLIAAAPAKPKQNRRPPMGPAIGPGKKLIKWGLDSPNSAYIRKNIREMEEWPLDGICVDADLRKDGRAAPLANGLLFSTRRFTYEELRHIVDDLRATRFTRFTDNFLLMGMSLDPLVFRDESWGYDPEKHVEQLTSPDWFNEAEFSVAVSNWALAARICREAGLKGFMMDVEQWNAPQPWNYRFLKAHSAGDFPSFEECVKKWRQRGRELMTAVCKEFPNITIINYQGSQQLAYDSLNWSGDPDPNLPPLANASYGLVSPFLDGMLEGMPDHSGATLVDGGPLYHATLDRRFKDYRAVSYRRSLQRSAVPLAFRKHTRLAFATWIDGRGWGTYPWSQTPPYYDNQFTPAELEHSLYYALLNADKYAWLWNEKAVFFPKAGKAQVLFGPNATVNDDYRRALANAKKLHRMDFKRDDRGALSEPLPPKASEQPGYGDEETFGPLDKRYEFLFDLPKKWRFCADTEGLGVYPNPFAQVTWELNGWNWKNWDLIETDDYFENHGYRFNGHAWYRCEFEVPASLSGKPIFLVFGGITLHPEYGAGVYVNGGRQGTRVEDLPSAFKGAIWDITALAKPGQKNVVIVRLLNYSGPGGLYKKVRLATRRTL